MFVGFTESKCYIQDLHLNKIMGTGSENGGLYIFDSPPSISSTCQTIGNLTATCFVSKSLLHNRLSHPSDQAVDVLQSNLKFTKDSHVSPCDICHKAKQTREPFPLSDHTTTIIGELVHVGLWGPYKVISKDGFRLPSSVLNCKSPFELVSEKCVFIGFSTIKKAYKVYSLESKLVFYSRDVKFYETVFPFKINSSLQTVEENHNDNINNLNFFNEKHFDDQTSSLRPNDDGIVYFTPNDEGTIFPCSRSTQSYDDYEVNIETSMGDNTSSEATVPSTSDLNAQNLPENICQVQPDLRRSSRNVKLPAKSNDYVVGSSREYGLEKHVTYSNLSKPNYCFSTTLNMSFEPISYYEAVKNPNWIEAMNNEIEALNRNNTWIICDLLEGRKAVGSKWQWNAKLTMTLLENGIVQSKFDYSLFTKKSDKVFIAYLVYVDDIVINCNDLAEIEKFKVFLKSRFQIKDLGKLKYFLGIEVLDNKEGICLSQRKYCLELLHEYDLLAAKHVDTNTTLNHIETDDEPLLDNIENYQKLVGKLIYLTKTRPNISYDVHCLSQYMHAPLLSHLDAVLRVLRYLKGSPRSGIQINKTGNLKLRAYDDSD
ncbi:ribonuclease H-like domain-containing protein [Tanacetum coccineum]